MPATEVTTITTTNKKHLTLTITIIRVVPMAWSPLRGLFVEQERVGTGVVDTSKREKIVAALKSVGEQMSKVSEGEASRGGVTEDQVALAWVMRHPSHPVPVLGTSKVERIRVSIPYICIHHLANSLTECGGGLLFRNE